MWRCSVTLMSVNLFQAARVVLVLLCLLLAACAQIWAKPGGTEAELESAKAACTTQSKAMFPPIMRQVQTAPSYSTPMQTNCTSDAWGMHCTTTGGSFVPASYSWEDANDNVRKNAFRSCLITAGWQPVKDKEEAALVTNSNSNSVPVK